MYNGALTEVELDCRRMRTRLLRTIPLYAHRATPAIEGEAWLPPMPDANHARALERACAALGRQPHRCPLFPIPCSLFPQPPDASRPRPHASQRLRAAGGRRTVWSIRGAARAPRGAGMALGLLRALR